ncbi:MAG: radical SAM protein [Odoribacter sp.]
MYEKNKILFIIPPFTQLNTPYPSTVYLKGYLNTQSITSEQVDLSLEVILRIFSPAGLSQLFAEIDQKQVRFSKNARRILERRQDYLRTIAPVIRFLQGQHDTLAYRIARDEYLPKAGRFHTVANDDLEWAFGTMGLRDKARYMATLYLEDLSDLIVECIDPEFGFSRYAEHLGRSASSFDEIDRKLHQPLSFTDRYLLPLLEEKIKETNPDLVAITIPFPGNLYSALRCGQWIKQHRPDLKIAMGGGFPNTELRSITECRFFEYTDFLLLDDGEEPLCQLIRYLNQQLPLSELIRTFTLDEKKKQVIYINNLPDNTICPDHFATPDYAGLPLAHYLSVIEIINPMHKLWSDGRWNKLTLAHGCYWGKCTFCDGSLDYIKRYAPRKASILVDQIEQIIAQTGEIGFHFVDEAAPPALLKEVALEIIKRHLTIVWWGNIRFEKSFTPELCFLLKSSGCIAVSGGLEVASDRLLQLINKGVSIKQVAIATQHLTQAGIMVHAYLMYGFPSETTLETIDSLEVVRQLFENGLIQSAFWHRFAMTAHSPVGLHPEKYHCLLIDPPFGGFARNDIQFTEENETPHELFGEGLRISLYNYMNATGIDLPLQKWFHFKIPHTTLPHDFIRRTLNEPKN